MRLHVQFSDESNGVVSPIRIQGNVFDNENEQLRAPAFRPEKANRAAGGRLDGKFT